MRIYSTENDRFRNASVIENATSRLKVSLCAQKASLKVLRKSLLFVLSEVDLSLPRWYKWHLRVKRLLWLVINESYRICQMS